MYHYLLITDYCHTTNNFQAVELGWIPTDWDNKDTLYAIKHSCDAFMGEADSLQKDGAGSVRNVLLLHSSSLHYYFVLYIFMCVAMMCVVIAALCMKSANSAFHNAYCSATTYFNGNRAGYTTVPDSDALLV